MIRKWDDDEFEVELDKVYDILWSKYTSGDWDTTNERKLLNILKCIDKELGR